MTNGQNLNQSQAQQQRPEQSERQQHTVFNNSPVHPENHQENLAGNQQNLPDVVLESTQSRHENPRGLYASASDKCDSTPDLIEHVHHHQSHEHFLPDFVPGYENRLTREDLEIKLSHQNKRYSTSSDYFSLDGSQMEDIQEYLDEEENDPDDPKMVHKGVNWHNLGQQLTEIASAFEVSYAPAMSPTQRIVYQEYQKLKIKSLALSRNDKTMMGLAKTICRQMLLSSIWILLKKIL